MPPLLYSKETTCLIDVDPHNSRLQLFPESLSVCLDNQQNIQLMPLEFATLAILKKNADTVLTYDELFQAIWTDGEKNKQYRLNNLIFHLRK
ncbi:hypothetical protein ATZ35_07135 [Enterococcus rotai]|uniref:OmpR/PhoB-type domain-containing protein n=1 Tax=Enterococcus rotai TaxID=118060 RepID=A0A0U2VH28_9ENTE|nr:hypothetical protein ATZ35_07135 [Enterococcus rotai]